MSFKLYVKFKDEAAEAEREVPEGQGASPDFLLLRSSPLGKSEKSGQRPKVMIEYLKLSEKAR